MAQNSVKAFGKAKIPNVIASEFLIKGGKRTFFQMLDGSNICSCKCSSAAVFVKDGK